MTTAFPDGFIWGTATAAHQVEGCNWNNDWWAWEHNPNSGCAEPSGDAVNQWDLYEHDLDLLAGFGFNTYRFSIEWSRIEPEDGLWSRAAIDHYRKVGEACLARGVTPMITFHHFTTPRWVCHHGGWEEPTTADRFAVFAHRAAEQLKDVLPYACTINEPNMVATHGYLSGGFPPGRRDPALRRAVNDVLIDAHRKAYDAIKSASPSTLVGLTVALQDNQALSGGEAYRDRVQRNLEDVYLEAAAGDDFIGVQCYTRARFGPDGNMPGEDGVPLTQMGYEVWPEALEATIRRAAAITRSPVIVTENGIGTGDDEQRIDYVQRALRGVQACLADGIDVRGYTYWSLLDNFEWAFGYRPTFGLVAVDRSTFERKPKPSAAWLGQIARANAY